MSEGDPHCLVCNETCPPKEGIQLINLGGTSSSLLQVISRILDREITEASAKSESICKKCHLMVNEEQDLVVNEIKSETSDSNFSSSGGLGKVIIKSDISLLDEEVVDHHGDDEADRESQLVELAESSSINLPKKILDIPSSDDDNSQHAVDSSGGPSVGKTGEQLQTIEDIEMELVKMHGGINHIEVKPTFPLNLQESGGSDSESEGPARAGDGVKVKSEGSDEKKPNILRRKKSIAMTVENMDVKEEQVNLPSHIAVARQDSMFTCMMCEGEETVAGDVRAMQTHLRTAHNLRIYICDVCGQDFAKRNELSAHMDEHFASEDGDFQCEVCNRIFNNLRLFRIHRRMHYPQYKAWTCDTCGKKYSSRNLLEEHENTHSGLRPYVCEQCGKDFASKYTFRAHEKTHEVRPRPYTCGQCPKTFLSQQNLFQHERTHTGVKDHSCHLCGKRFGSAHNLEVHSIVHTGFRPFACSVCNKSFARKAEIRDHERTHTGERPYQCEMCGATFSQRSNLQSHKRATHYDDKRYLCVDCNKGFKRRRLLDYHIKAVHTGERPFKCTVCDATFVYPEHFKKHRRIHTGEKPFRCEVCGKAFNSRDNRNAHRFVHSDKKPYECLVCSAGFMRKPLLYQHMQTAGHLNDTIVVNQPRLTTDDDQLVTVNSKGEMEIVDPVAVDDGSINADDSKLYISEHILQDGDNEEEEEEETEVMVVEGEDGDEEDDETVEHIIIDGEAIRFENEEEELDTITGEALADSETQIIETPDGPVQLVRVRIPNESGEEEEAWIKIVSE